MGIHFPSQVVVITGGDTPHARVVQHLENDCLVIAADSGWDNARTLGLTPHILVGDFDSISSTGLAEARALGTQILEHPADKDFSDAELALEIAAQQGSSRITVIGGGDRFDHVVGVLHILTNPSHVHLALDAHFGSSRLTRVSPQRSATLRVAIGTTISIHAIGGTAGGVSTRGVKWPLTNETLDAHVSRGVSNIATEGEVHVSTQHGMVLVIEPHFLTEGNKS